MCPTRKQIEAVHSSVNRLIMPMTDLAQYGVKDRWVTDPASHRGDCEDYALTKKARLLALGATQDDLRVVVGHTWRGESHAVLYARDDAGLWWVLDNQSGRIVRPAKHSFKPGPAGPWGEPVGAR